MVAPTAPHTIGQQIDRERTGQLAILCDFDGTVVQIDTAEYILDRFAKGDWRSIDRQMEEGTITIEECMKRQFEMVSLTRERMLRELDEVTVPRTGFGRLVEACRAGSIEVIITSAGLDFYIAHFLERNGWADHVKMVAPRVTDSGDGVRFEFPEKRYKLARNFKEDWVLRKQRTGKRVVYIGDGVSDYWAAMIADKVFAVKESRLARRLRFGGRFHQQFTDFGEVMCALEL
jgi:2-hydroxy-3-keto-5-methylthiopentenyl-1-phosphate phosphatase